MNLILPEEWTHGDAAGVCTERSTYDCSLLVEVEDVENDAQVASVLAHEYAHALLHFDVDDANEQVKREVEAESTAYVVSQHFGLDASNSAFYVAAWDGDPAETIQNRLQRIVDTAQEIIEAVEMILESTDVDRPFDDRGRTLERSPHVSGPEWLSRSRRFGSVRRASHTSAHPDNPRHCGHEGGSTGERWGRPRV